MKFQYRPKYAKISLKRRQKLVKLVIQGDMQIARASRILGIKPSTAKLIVKRFKVEGTFFQSRESKEKRVSKEKQAEQQLPKLEENIEFTPNLNGIQEERGLNANLTISASYTGSQSEQTSTFPMFWWNLQHQVPSWIMFYIPHLPNS